MDALQYKDFYDYIKEEKKKIIFTRVLDNQSFKVLVPCSLRKNELYLTSNYYKKFEYSDFQLFHNGKFMNNDETTIDCVKEGDEIKIIELLHGVDFSYYDMYLLKNKNELKILIKFDSPNNENIFLNLTSSTSISEMAKVYFNLINVPKNKAKENYSLHYNYEKLDFNDESTLESKGIRHGAIITVQQLEQLTNFSNGKYLKVLIKAKNEEINTFTGTLSTIKGFYFKNSLEYYGSSITMKINGKEYSKDDERTFSSIGIRDDFICYLDIIEKK